MSNNAYYPSQQGNYNPPPPSYGQPQFTGPNYNGPPPPAYGQPTFTGPYDQQAPTVIVQQPAQPQYVVVEERRQQGLTADECCCIAMCAFCCGLCLNCN